jgi:hypothetical protein
VTVIRLLIVFILIYRNRHSTLQSGYFTRDFTGKDIFLEVLRNKSVPIRDRNTNIPHKLAKVIDLSLIEEPEIHFKTAKAFKQALLSVS